MTTRAALHRLLDQVPESEVGEYVTLFEAYRSHDRVLVQSLLAPEVQPEPDEDPATEEDIRDAESFDNVLRVLDRKDVYR